MRPILLAAAVLIPILFVAASCDDSGGGSSKGSGSAAVNNAPVANGDTLGTAVNTPADLNVLANDSDVDGDVLSVSTFGAANFGTPSLIGLGVVRYTPATGFSGADSFSYTISDGKGGTAVGNVIVTVSTSNTAPVAGNDNLSTPMNTVADANVLANDSDVDGDTITIASFAQGAHGGVSQVGNLLRYVPVGGYFGADAFSYTINDGNGGTDNATVSVDVVWVNTAPVAQSDAATTPVGLPVAIDAVANDSDADGHALDVVSVSTPANGTATILVTGSIRYTPGTGFAGTDSFDYTCEDGYGGSDTATITVTVSVPSWTVSNTSTVVSDYGAHSVAIADFNNDSKPDLAFANARASTTTVHMNTTTTGTPGFASLVGYASGLIVDIAAVDVNGDGRPDLLSPAFLGGDLRVRLNNPANPGSFLAQQVFGASSSGMDVPWDIANGDLDGDGKLDVVMAHMNDREISVMQNLTATGSNTANFTMVNSYASQAATATTNPSGVALADLNGDGKLDLVSSTPDSGGQVWVRMNTTTGGNISFSNEAVFASAGDSTSIACGDINGDGRADIVVANRYAYNVAVLINQTATGATSGSFAAAVTFATVGNAAAPEDVVLADLTGDGRLDIACCSINTSTLTVWLNFSAPGTLNLSGPAAYNAAAGYHLAIADLNADGILDIVVSNDGASDNAVLTGQ